jgi:hypothetical protein
MMTAIMTAHPAAASRAAADLRLLRSALFAVVCVALAAAGHTASDGSPLPAWSLAASWVAVTAVTALAAGRERSLAGIAGGLLLGQLLLHLLFMGVQFGPDGAHAAGHAMASAPLGLTPSMLLGHALAALAAGWWLRLGETALWELLRFTARVAADLGADLRAALAPLTVLVSGAFAPPARPCARWADRDAGPAPAGSLLQHCVVRRGPPAGSAAG